jgi:hypothetical protein
MKSSDIEIGATYAHSEYPGTVYLGCGEDGYGGKSGKHKFLIILYGDWNPRGKYCGAKVKPGSRNACDRAWWSKFSKLSKSHA